MGRDGRIERRLSIAKRSGVVTRAIHQGEATKRLQVATSGLKGATKSLLNILAVEKKLSRDISLSLFVFFVFFSVCACIYMYTAPQTDTYVCSLSYLSSRFTSLWQNNLSFRSFCVLRRAGTPSRTAILEIIKHIEKIFIKKNNMWGRKRMKWRERKRKMESNLNRMSLILEKMFSLCL